MKTNKCAAQDKCITCAFLIFFKYTKSSRSAYMPVELYAALKTTKRLFKILNFRQQDAHELLLLVIEEMSSQKHSLKCLQSNFVADVRTVVKCSVCKDVYKSDGIIGDFAIDIHGQKSVQSALDLYFSWESVNDHDCDCCKVKVSARKQFSLVSAPSCLCIHLKRFLGNKKVTDDIEITPELTIAKYFAELPDPRSDREWKYRLATVINHIGKTSTSGHYTTVVCAQNNEYYEFNDETIRQVRSENAVKGDEAYILFYELIEDIPMDGVVKTQEGIPMDGVVKTQEGILYDEHGFQIMNEVDLDEFTPIEIEIVADETGQVQKVEENQFLYVEHEVISSGNIGHFEKFTRMENDILPDDTERIQKNQPLHVEHEVNCSSNIGEENFNNVVMEDLEEWTEVEIIDDGDTSQIDRIHASNKNNVQEEIHLPKYDQKETETETDSENETKNIGQNVSWERSDELSGGNEIDTDSENETENIVQNVSCQQIDELSGGNEIDTASENETENIVQNVSAEQIDGLSEDNEIKTDSENETKNIVQNLSAEPIDGLHGRRILDIGYLFKQMLQLSNNVCRKCNEGEMAFASEIKKGLISVFKFHCNSCGYKKRVESCPVKGNTNANTNEGAVSGIVSIGLGHYHLQEFLAHLNIQGMSYPTYNDIDKKLQNHTWRLAKKLEEEALQEEIRIAIEIGEVDSAGNALIAVEFDGSWGKRSYGNNFSSLSGCAAIIGLRTGKILYSDVKNKYCHVCKIAQSRNTPPNNHECNRNYDGPSSGMETQIIVEGFIYCEQKRARFTKFVGDGDSSTYKALRDLRLYKNPDLEIEKFECVNHLFKNFRKKFTALLNSTKFSQKGRKLLRDTLGNDICVGVRKAAEYWRLRDIDPIEKYSNVERDALNAALHYLGIHDKCQPYFCKKTTDPSIKTTITILKDTGVYYEILDLCQYYFANNAKSLIENLCTNKTEGFNSQIAKTLAGKRVCNSLAGSYKSRTAIADVHFNTKGHSGSKYHEFAFGDLLQSCVKLENKRKRKLVKNAIAKRAKPKKQFIQTTRKKGKRKRYGAGREEIDFTPSAYELAKNRHMEKLLEDQLNRDVLEVETRGQRHILKWIVVRRNLLTPSYFGRILNVNSRKSYTNIVDEIIYKNEIFANTTEIRHQRMFQLEALEIFYDLYGCESIATCGIVIDTEFAFLGTSPFRLYGEDSIICVKCPKAAYKKSMKEAIDKKLIPFWKGQSSDREINLKSHWYYEIQGQLRITQRSFAYLVIYLGESVYEVIEKIERNDDFWKTKMEKELVFFYNEAMLKELINPRDARGMDLRKYNPVSETFD